MARRLQEQENTFISNQKGDTSRSKPGGRVRKYVPLEDKLSEIQTRVMAGTGHRPGPVKSLESIIQEEEAEEKKKKELVSWKKNLDQLAPLNPFPDNRF